MRKLWCLVLVSVCVLVLHAPAQEKSTIPYKIKFDKNKDIIQMNRSPEGKEVVYVKVRFTIALADGASVEKLDGNYKIRIEEDGKLVREVELPRAVVSQEPSVMFAIDTSNSMKGFKRLEQVRSASEMFLQQLPASAECGLILFDQEIRQTVKRSKDRAPLMAKINTIDPRGETAYLDAAHKGIEMLRDTPKGRDRALVLMTDGIDMQSRKTIQQVIDEANKEKVRVYTIGIGEPGKLEKVSTVLVLDHSGSMSPPADDKDTTPKIKALHQAGYSFVDSMSSFGRASIIPFSTTVGKPRDFLAKAKGTDLKRIISALEPRGETALFDATYTAVSVLEADGTKGKRAVIAMTDGVDNSSRRRVEEVIEYAQQANIPLYMLGFGRKEEIDEETMELMASKTKGKYYHAKNKDSLVEIFENLSIQLHDNGIDEDSLQKIAAKTGGRYYSVKNVSDLKLILTQVGKSIQSLPPFEVGYESLNQRADGAVREIALSLVHDNTVIEKQIGSHHRRGLVVAEMNHLVYLVLLVLIGGLIALPGLLRRRAAA